MVAGVIMTTKTREQNKYANPVIYAATAADVVDLHSQSNMGSLLVSLERPSIRPFYIQSCLLMLSR